MEAKVQALSPQKQRARFREGLDLYVNSTSGLCPGYEQANLVILPKRYAFDFFLFAHRNPKACPILDVLEAGEVEPKIAKGADIRSDLPKYRLYEAGILVEEVNNLTPYWQKDFVTFLIGCSLTFEKALLDKGIPMLHQQANQAVAMYNTSIQTTPAGVFSGPVVVSMRPIRNDCLMTAVDTTARFTNSHGSPLHIGDPEAIGIPDLTNPDYGAYTPYDPDVYTPVFWACGVTPQAVAAASKPAQMITHVPGCMFISDRRAMPEV
ncbi:putative hydro-lyase [Shouchella clausii]|uniref:putative hydro-lyase n=1 Tax=Shouchella clausii TaxID=79880 RepID=UPI0031FC1909